MNKDLLQGAGKFQQKIFLSTDKFSKLMVLGSDQEKDHLRLERFLRKNYQESS
jgi:hypothetical protein